MTTGKLPFLSIQGLWLIIGAAHRPTFDPARGKEAQKGPAYHQRLLPAHTQLKIRQPGQGGNADPQVRDLRAQLLEAEAAHYSKKNGFEANSAVVPSSSNAAALAKRQLVAPLGEDNESDEDPQAKRQRILEETRNIDADSDESASESGEEESDEEDETAELLRELEKIKEERAEQRQKEVCCAAHDKV
ncbi:complexed with cef1p [Lambiella insularis]|nr:complexed with cef1p [Lambiella insularis]